MLWHVYEESPVGQERELALVKRLGRASCASKHDRRLDQHRTLCPGLERDATALVKATLPPLAPSSTNTNFAPAAQADFPGALACHSSVWQEEGTSREVVHYSVH